MNPSSKCLTHQHGSDGWPDSAVEICINNARLADALVLTQPSAASEDAEALLQAVNTTSSKFGGKLVHFGNKADVPPQVDHMPSRFVHIHQEVSEPELRSKSDKLESLLAKENLVDFCHSKIKSSLDEQDGMTWSFLQDYPSLSQINSKIIENKILNIFAVPDSELSLYQRLTTQIEGTYAERLESDASNIVDLIHQQYNKIQSKVEPDFLKVTYSSKCLGKL